MFKKYKAALIAISIASILAAVFGAAWSWQGSRCDVSSLRADLDDERLRSEQILSDLLKERRMRIEIERIAANRNQERDSAANIVKSLEQELERARNQDTPYAKCIDMPLPNLLAERLSEALRRSH